MNIYCNFILDAVIKIFFLRLTLQPISQDELYERIKKELKRN